MTRPEKIDYFVFDVESIANGKLISQVRYPEEDLPPSQAVRRYRDELMEKHGSDFIPYTYQLPIAVVIAKVRRDYSLQDIVVLDSPEYRPHIIAENFWRGWEAYKHPTFVTFNGRAFDLPLMELAAFQFGIPIKSWLDDSCRSFEQPRYRFNSKAHLDLQDMLVNYGASRFNGGLNLAATLLGKPGKMSVQGDMVQDMFEEGKLEEINDYCRCDVLDTYFVFLRTRVITGKLSLDREQELVAETKEWLLERADQSPAFASYLDHWNDWPNPWKSVDSEEPTDEASSASTSGQSSSVA